MTATKLDNFKVVVGVMNNTKLSEEYTETLSPQIEDSELILGTVKAGEYELAAAIKYDHFWSFQQYAYKNWKIGDPVVSILFS